MNALAAKATVCQPCRLRLLQQLYHAWRPATRGSQPFLTPPSHKVRPIHTRSSLYQGPSAADGSRAQEQARFVESEEQHDTASGGSIQRGSPIEEETQHLDLELPQDRQENSSQTVEDAVRIARQEFGDRLPAGVLSEEEYKMYERLYGPPLSEQEVQSLAPVKVDQESEKDVLLREAHDGSLEEVGLQGEEVDYDEHDLDDVVLGDEESLEETLNGHVKRRKRGGMDDERLQRDIEVALAATTNALRSPHGSHSEAENNTTEVDDTDAVEYDAGDTRTHPFTLANRFATSPSTLHLPYEDIVGPVSSLLAKLPNKHIDEAASKIFGGPALPYATGSPLSAKIMPQKPLPLGPGQSKMSEMEADLYLAAVMPGAYAAVTGVLVEVRKRLGTAWIEGLLKKDGGPRILDVGAGGAGVVAWRQVLKAEWNRIHNIEPGRPKAEASEDLGHDEDVPSEQQHEDKITRPPLGKATVLASSHALQQRASLLLDNTTFLPRLPDYVHAHFDPDAQRKQYDVIVAPYSLWHLQENYERRQRVLNLWSLLDPHGGVLILLEKGVPRGFEVIADARAYLLGELFEGGKEASDSEISASSTYPSSGDPAEADLDDKQADTPQTLRGSRRAPGRILAPCTNHNKCPMYLVPGVSRQRKDWCHFSQRYIRPPYYQRILGAKDRNHEDVHFSYVAVQKGVSFNAGKETKEVKRGEKATSRAFDGYDFGDADLAPHAGIEAASRDGATEAASAQDTTVESQGFPNSLSLPRLVFPPLKKPGHVILDVCTPSGTLERWSVPRSFGKQSYRDARKSKWGDLWALGAKQRSERRVRLGMQHYEQGFGVGRGMEGKKTKKVLDGEVQEVGAGLGKAQNRKPAKGGYKDVRGRSRATTEAEEEAPSGKEKRLNKQRAEKERGRQKARSRRREETKALFRTVDT